MSDHVPVPHIFLFGMIVATVGIVLGIALVDLGYAPPAVVAPELVGKPLREAVQLAGAAGLSVRWTHDRIDASREAGTVLTQYPRPGMHMKARQHLLVSTARSPHPEKMPSCVGQTEVYARQELERVKAVPVVMRCWSSEPVGQCIAQSVIAPGQPLEGTRVVVWVSQGPHPLRIMPVCTGMTVRQLKKSLEPYMATLRSPEGNQELCDDDRVVKQYPIPGSVLDRLESFVVYVTTERVG